VQHHLFINLKSFTYNTISEDADVFFSLYDTRDNKQIRSLHAQSTLYTHTGHTQKGHIHTQDIFTQPLHEHVKEHAVQVLEGGPQDTHVDTFSLYDAHDNKQTTGGRAAGHTHM
jgi:hypothetical protein